MKTRTFLNNPIISLVISLLLVFSFMSLPVTIETVDAAVIGSDNITVTSPTAGAPAYAKTGGSVDIHFTVTCNTTDENADFILQVLTAGTTSVVATANINSVDISTLTQSFDYPITLTGVATGTYDCRVAARQPTGSGTFVYSDSSANSVIVDNTAPTVTLTTPNGGNYVKANTAYTVQWNATDAIPATANVYVRANYSIDGGTTYPSVAFAEQTKAKGVATQNWTAPDIDCATAKLQLIVRDEASNETTVTSASNFYIIKTAPTVAISIPNASTSWNGGSTQTITFTTTSYSNLNVDYKLEFSSDGATWTTITPGTGGWVTNQPVGLTSYSWTVINTYRGAAARIKATVRDKVLQEANLTSGLFTIVDVTAPTVTITAPQAGDKVYNGVATNILWTANDNVVGPNLNYEWFLSIDGGSSWESLGTETSAQGSKTQPWTPSTTEIKNNCKIKVTAADLATTPNTGQAISSAFSMYPSGVAPTITLTSPLGGESWQGGNSRAITWTASDPNDATGTLDYLLEYTDNGTGWANIALLEDRDQGSNAFCWAVPTNATAAYQVRVTATSPGGGAATDTSDAFIVTSATAGVETATLTLKTGWNLVSLQLMPTVCPSTTTTFNCSYPIESVLADCLDKIVSVWYYPQGVGTTWLHWAPGVPSSLTTMTDGKAYWIYMSGNDTATYQGRKGPAGGGFPTTPYQYYIGWNQVGFKSTVNKTVQTYLGGTPGTTYVVPIYGWVSDNQTWSNIAADGNMTSGSGYWVYFNVNHIVNAGAD